MSLFDIDYDETEQTEGTDETEETVLDDEVTDLETELFFIVQGGEPEKISLKDGVSVTVGRCKNQKVIIPDKTKHVSREHLVLKRNGNYVEIEVKGQNGIKIDDEIIKYDKTVDLKPHKKIVSVPVAFEMEKYVCYLETDETVITKNELKKEVQTAYDDEILPEIPHPLPSKDHNSQCSTPSTGKKDEKPPEIISSIESNNSKTTVRQLTNNSNKIDVSKRNDSFAPIIENEPNYYKKRLNSMFLIKSIISIALLILLVLIIWSSFIYKPKGNRQDLKLSNLKNLNKNELLKNNEIKKNNIQLPQKKDYDQPFEIETSKYDESKKKVIVYDEDDLKFDAYIFKRAEELRKQNKWEEAKDCLLDILEPSPNYTEAQRLIREIERRAR